MERGSKKLFRYRCGRVSEFHFNNWSGKSVGSHQHVTLYCASRGVGVRHPEQCPWAKKPVIEVEPDAQFAWTKHVNEIANGTLYPRCNSWYLGANILGKPQVFMPYKGFAAYVAKCNNIKATGFRGFKFSDWGSTQMMFENITKQPRQRVSCDV